MPQWAEIIVAVIVFFAFLVGFVSWIWGTINPASFNKFAKQDKGFTRKQSFVLGGITTVVLFILMGVTVTWASSPTFDLAGFKNDRAVTDAAQYEINGSVFDGTSKLTINGQPVAIDGSGNFKASEKLNEGDNAFVLLAVNAKGDRKTQETFTIHRTTAAEFAARQAKAAVLGDKTEKTPSPTPSASPTRSPTPSPTPSTTPKPTPKPTVAATPKTVYHTPTPAPATPVPAPAAPAGCTPLTSGGNCYKPGEYCRASDHGATGIAGDGERIACEYNNGWRWEPI